MVQGISHITIMVRDLDKTSRLLCEGLGAKEVYDSQDKNYSISREKFFLLGGIWLVAMEGENSEKSYRHVPPTLRVAKPGNDAAPNAAMRRCPIRSSAHNLTIAVRLASLGRLA
ncbi:MAG: hypothetical protein QNI88_12345 [Desulfobacterales bacterium]|nr:hypothetical protein [Desulfobacterales bacterium]